MFYELIRHKRDQWYASADCTIDALIDYIVNQGRMRDAQLEAIKTYLYLKIACGNRPLWMLFNEGAFNADIDIDLDSELLGTLAREELRKNGAAMALFQYSRLKDQKGKQLAPELERFIRSHAETINYAEVFSRLFYDVSYTDYLFSLPMGAGKTYLMAAFIYLDLYLAQSEPDNAAFAHNFIILAPSGLKSSIVPSLKNIKEFDPTWVLPKNSADQIERMIHFEILDEQKSAKRSNRIKNPNAQKITCHGIPEYQFGLVAITNAEKVILDRIDQSGADPTLFKKEELERIKVANELRDVIGRLPNLAIYIDEVHHATDSDIKLRQVVNGWAQRGTFNSTLGFTGTPYLEKAEPIAISDEISVKNIELSNVVYYYPLVEGVGNFLKQPIVKYAFEPSESIVSNAVVDFISQFKNKKYANGTWAKQAIYCGTIDNLEEVVYPLVAQLAAQHGLNPIDAVLRYHDGNKKHKAPEGAVARFASLDTAVSQVRFVLLVQIGKEGWDCRSLTSVVLPHRGVCPTNMVLQTSCRCLREVVKSSKEKALIWMNKENADILNKQLLKQQNITLEEFSHGTGATPNEVQRFSRQDIMQVPPISYFQLHVEFEDYVTQPVNTIKELKRKDLLAKKDFTLVYTGDFDQLGSGRSVIKDDDERVPVTFNGWIYQIAKESFGTLTTSELKTYEKELSAIFALITKDGYTDGRYDHPLIRSRIRQAFLPKRDYRTKEVQNLSHAELLILENLMTGIEDGKYHPSPHEVQEILKMDQEGAAPPPPPEMIEYCRRHGLPLPMVDAHDERKQTYHYLPYHFDSAFEIDYFRELLSVIKDKKKLEAYFNGDDTVTQFRIKCYRRERNHWSYIGYYVPDFILLSRKADGRTIDRVMIVETKGEGFAAKFRDRRLFMETKFKEMNKNFEFLYIEDTLDKDDINKKTITTIQRFFK